jgi:spermidine/putrescine transport system permease protein
MRKEILGVIGLWIILFYLGPILVALIFSFLTPKTYGGVEWTPTLEAYKFIKPDLFSRTAIYAVIAAILCTGLALTISVEALLHPSPVKSKFIVGLVAFSLVTNSLIKIYSWILLLGASGPLAFLGLPFLEDEKFRVGLGLVYMYLPFAMLMIHEGVQAIDPGLIRAARDLGAGDGAIARRILLPLSKPFAVSAAFIVAVFCFAEFLIPEVLGRGKVILTGNRMADLFTKQFNWPACMAIGSVIVVLLFAILSLHRRREA